jgi:hypothetical protein
LLLATGAAEAFARRLALAELSDDSPVSDASHELADALLRLFH